MNLINVRTEERIVELKLILAEMEKMGTKFETEITELKKVIEESKKEKDDVDDDNDDDEEVEDDKRSEDTQSVISRQIRAIRKSTTVFGERTEGKGLQQLQ